MVEMAEIGPHKLQQAFGGDTANTAIYLARLTQGFDITVDYVTALGDDAYSEAMLDLWRTEGVGTGMVTRLKGRLPELYTIRTDEAGERSFTYWRGQSAARDLLRDGRDKTLASVMSGVDLVYLSGITLSILDDQQRNALLAILDVVRAAGGKVAFDGNFRPAGWPSKEEARASFQRVLARTDIALPTFDDEQALFGDPGPGAVATRVRQQAVSEVVVKLGAAGCFLATDDGTEMIDTTPVGCVVDSTAAGDSFNAGYLAGRLLDWPPADAARLGHRLAGEVICHHGAVIPKDAMPEGLLGECLQNVERKG